MNDAREPLRLLICALGGEGGGVLMNWVVSAARAAGCRVQATSIPGVAQRTGSTTYYVEIARPGDQDDGVLGLVPMPGRVDVVLASELVEAARAIELGHVSPALTTLIASSSRVYSTAEKIPLGDGRYDEERVRGAAEAMTRQCYLLDLETLARAHGTFISATLFGALAGSGVLPWGVDVSRGVLGAGRGAEKSLAGFDAACEAVSSAGEPAPAPGVSDGAPALPDDVVDDAPPVLRAVLAHGFHRAVDYQDRAYGDLYLERCRALAAVAGSTTADALEEACRRLALWMTYEDVARVADLKTRAERFARIRAEAELEPGQILKVTEYLKPRAEEIAAVMPVALGRWIVRRARRGGWFPLLGRGMRVRSNGVFGFHLLRLVAALRHVRRSSLRFHEESQAIESWLESMRAVLPTAPRFAAALAELPRVLKGYSDTQARGLAAYDRIVAEVVRPALADGASDEAAEHLQRALAAALADEDHRRLDEVLASAGLAEAT